MKQYVGDDDRALPKWLRHTALTVPRLSAQAREALVKSGIDRELIRDFFISVSEVGELIDALPGPAIRFPGTTRRQPTKLSREFLVAHWKEIAGRLILASQCADRTLADLLSAFVLGLEHRNALLAALTARAALEAAVSYDDLSQVVNGRQGKIEREVLPLLRQRDNPPRISTLHDSELVDVLIRFEQGRRFWPVGSSPDTPAEWKQWVEESEYEDVAKAKKAGRAQSTAGQILDALDACQRNVLTSLKRVARRTPNMAVLGLYNLLSEFCHPNADNRSLSTLRRTDDSENVCVEFVEPGTWSPGVKKGIWIGMMAMIEAVDIHLNAHNRISESSRELLQETTD